MLSTNQAFDKFRSTLELSQTEREDAAKRHKEVRECIKSGFEIKNDFLSGSYARGTKTKPLKDVDVMFVMGAGEKSRRDKPPIETLEAYKKQLEKDYPGAVSIGRRSVTVEFEKSYYAEGHEGKVLSIDCVPAFEFGDDYEIPDKVTKNWIKTNPKKHASQATAKNLALGGNWVPLVKMIKAWNKANGVPVKPSFLLEVMAEGLIDAPFQDYQNELRNFFSSAASTIQDDWADPAKLGPPVSDQMTDDLIGKAKVALLDAERKASNAIRLERTSQGDALRIWREVLGPYFPLS